MERILKILELLMNILTVIQNYLAETSGNLEEAGACHKEKRERINLETVLEFLLGAFNNYSDNLIPCRDSQEVVLSSVKIPLSTTPLPLLSSSEVLSANKLSSIPTSGAVEEIAEELQPLAEATSVEEPDVTASVQNAIHKILSNVPGSLFGTVLANPRIWTLIVIEIADVVEDFIRSLHALTTEADPGSKSDDVLSSSLECNNGSNDTVNSSASKGEYKPQEYKMPNTLPSSPMNEMMEGEPQDSEACERFFHYFSSMDFDGSGEDRTLNYLRQLELGLITTCERLNSAELNQIIEDIYNSGHTLLRNQKILTLLKSDDGLILLKIIAQKELIFKKFR